MDNDLMARRLRPPSEPAQTAPSPAPFTLPEYEAAQAVPTLPKWPPAPLPGEDLAPPPVAEVAPWPLVTDETTEAFLEDAVSYEASFTDEPRAEYETAAEPELTPAYETAAEIETPAAYEPAPWSPQAREEVPWDRPNDYEQPTDTATPDQLSWDRPAPGFWADPDAMDDPTAEMFEPDAGVERPELPPWPQTTSAQPAAVASTPRVDEASATPVLASDPDDAYAPVLGDVSAPTGRAWPEMNGHDAGRNDATVAAEAIAQAQAPATEPAPTESVQAFADARADWDEPTRSGQSWPDSGPMDTDWTPDRAPVPTEWGIDALETTESAAEPEAVTEPEPATETESAAEPESATEYELGAEADPLAGFVFATEHEPAAEFVAEPESVSEPEFADEPEPAAELEPVPAPGLSPEPVASAPQQPLVVRLELAIVDDSIHIVGPPDAVWMVNDDNAVVLEVGKSELATQTERFTPRHPAFEPRAQNGDEHQADSDWLEPILPGPSAGPSIPPPTLDPPWLAQNALTRLETQPAPSGRGADPGEWPVSNGPVAVPPASPQPPPWVQSANDSPWSNQSPTFGPPAAPPSAFAPPVAPATALQEQSDLWFLPTAPADIDAAGKDEVVVAKESSVLLALLTIGFAILVLVLVLAFIWLMTSFLG